MVDVEQPKRRIKRGETDAEGVETLIYQPVLHCRALVQAHRIHQLSCWVFVTKRSTIDGPLPPRGLSRKFGTGSNQCSLSIPMDDGAIELGTYGGGLGWVCMGHRTPP